MNDLFEGRNIGPPRRESLFSQNAVDQSGVLSSDQRLPRYLALRDDLAYKISDGRWNFVEPIPSESSLAKHYGVSLGTVRRAIEELVREGIVERRQGSGTYIRRSDFSGSLSHYLRFRSSHSKIAFQECRVLDMQKKTPPPSVGECLGLTEGTEAIFLDRKRFHDGELLVSDEIWLEPSRFTALLSLPREEIGSLIYRTYERCCGQVVARAEESLKVSVASTAVAALLEIQPGSPVIIIERTSYDGAGHALEWRRSYAKADNFEYRIEIR